MPNSLSQVPPGSLLRGENVVVDYDGLLSGRRGIRQFGVSLADLLVGPPPTNVFEEFFYKGTKIVWFGNPEVDRLDPSRHRLAYDSDGLGTWVVTGSGFPAPAYALTDKYRSTQSNNNLYLTSVTGILKIDDPATAPYAAGGLPGLDGTAALVDVAGFLSDDSAVAYRMTWKTTDVNHNVVEGTPSTRVVISNSSGGDRNVQLTFTIPHGAATTDQWVIYRSPMSASATTEPSDELQQVLQGNPSPTDLSNGFFTVKDAVPQSQLGAALYTNSGQEGITQANNIPPLANDMCFFQGYVIYGAATTQQKFLLSLLSTGGPDGIQNGDTFTVTTDVDSFTLTGAASENISLGHFKVFTGGDPASDILDTKLSLIRVLNRQPQLQVYAYDSSDPGGSSLPGDFFLQEQGISRVQFGVSSSRSTCWFPALTTTPSDNLSLPGGSLGSGFCSKFQQPEAVPVANTISVGNKNFEWLRCLPLRNSVIVLKADGCFQLTGTAFPFTVTTLDLGTILVAPETPTVMNNQVFAYTNQGVVAITETGPGIVSRPIENLLQVISSYLYPNFPKVTFGTSYETDRKWIMSTISAADGFTTPTLQYVYDIITQTWTTYKYPVPIWDLKESPTEHRLYAASASELYPFVFQERKSFTNSDFADIEIPTTIVSFSGRTLEVSDTTGAKVGWSIAQLTTQGDNEPSIVTQISKITNIVDDTHLMVEDSVTWDLGPVFTAYEQPIAIDVMFTPIVGGPVTTSGNNVAADPATVKFFQEANFLFQSIQFNALTAYFTTDFITSAVPVPIVPVQPEGGWGDAEWGPPPWGGGVSSTQSIRTYVPIAARRAHWLNLELKLSEAMSNFTLAGIALTYRTTTTRVK